MKSNKSILLFSVALLMVFSALACSSSNVNSDDDIIRNQTGTLEWAGTPAADGAGMLFVVDDKKYGAPGTPEDYPELFEDDQHEAVEIRADYKLTGEDSIRGWGVTFPAIEFIKIEKI